MKIEIPREVAYIIEKLEASGFRADIVGGCVRDAILGRVPNDYDITTSAPPDEIKRIFWNERTVDTGIAHGTVTVVIDGAPYEVTTYRIDGEYLDNRHPSSVRFSRDISEDLARRDFTVNAMAYSDKHGLTDKFFGKKDLEKKQIRAVGDAVARFSEDALRIIRALRFAATLGFSVEEKTALAIKSECWRLKNVSAERIFSELRRLFGGTASYDIVRDFFYVFSFIDKSLSEMRLIDRERWSELSSLERALSLYALNSTPEGFLAAATLLKTDKKTRDIGYSALSHLTGKPLAYSDVYKLIIECGDEVARAAVNLSVALGYSCADARLSLEKIISGDYPRRVSQLPISGNDMLTLGYSGKEVGNALLRSLYAVARGEVECERAALIDFAGKMKN